MFKTTNRSIRFVAEISQQVQAEMEDMLKSIREIDENSGQITEEIDKCKESALEKKRGLEESKEQVEKAAYAVLQMLNNSIPLTKSMTHWNKRGAK
ncbi:hypothetical protein ACLB2K_068469 [Fragaria x ananassa]